MGTVSTLRTNRGMLALALAGVMAVVGCASQAPVVTKDQYLKATTGKPQPLQQLYWLISAEGEQNAVLNNEQCGLAAFEMGNYTEAAACFDAALGEIEKVYPSGSKGADNADKARSLWYNEGAKKPLP